MSTEKNLDENVSELLKEVSQKIKENNFLTAIALCSNIVNSPTVEDGDKATAFLRRGYCYMQTSEHTKAITDFNTSYLLGSPDTKVKAMVNCGLTFLRFPIIGNISSAKHCLNLALDVDPHCLPALTNLSLVFSMEENFHEAIKYAELGLQISKGNHQILKNLSTLYSLTGEHLKAIEYIEKALLIFPADEDGEYHATRAMIYYEAGEYKKAFEDEKIVMSRSARQRHFFEQFQLHALIEINIALLGEENGGLKAINQMGIGTNGKTELLSIIRSANNEPTTERRAARLALGIYVDQPFKDGNSRTGCLAFQFALLETEETYCRKRAYELYAKIHSLGDDYHDAPDKTVNALINWVEAPGQKNKSGDPLYKKSKKPKSKKMEILKEYLELPGLLKEIGEVQEPIEIPGKGKVKLINFRGYVLPEMQDIYKKTFSLTTRLKFNQYFKDSSENDHDTSQPKKALSENYFAISSPTDTTNSNQSSNMIKIYPVPEPELDTTPKISALVIKEASSPIFTHAKPSHSEKSSIDAAVYFSSDDSSSFSEDFKHRHTETEKNPKTSDITPGNPQAGK